MKRRASNTEGKNALTVTKLALAAAKRGGGEVEVGDNAQLPTRRLHYPTL